MERPLPRCAANIKLAAHLNWKLGPFLLSIYHRKPRPSGPRIHGRLIYQIGQNLTTMKHEEKLTLCVNGEGPLCIFASGQSANTVSGA